MERPIVKSDSGILSWLLSLLNQALAHNHKNRIDPSDAASAAFPHGGLDVDYSSVCSSQTRLGNAMPNSIKRKQQAPVHTRPTK